MGEIREASVGDLEILVPLFEAYRQFYGAASDREGARRFLRERMERGDSTIFLAWDKDGAAVGFVQLYPSFTSLGMAPILILNDLYIRPDARRRGIGSALLRAAAAHGQRVGARRLVLSTQVENRAAQSAYEAMGWKRDTAFCTYELALGADGADGGVARVVGE